MKGKTLPTELMVYVIGYCDRRELAAFCKTSYAMYTLAAPKLYKHLRLDFRDPDEDYQEHISPYSFEGRERALRGDFDAEKNAASRKEAFDAHCIWSIIRSDRIDRSWVKMLTVRYIKAVDDPKRNPDMATHRPWWPDTIFDGLGDDSDGDQETAAWAMSSPLRGQGQELTETDFEIHYVIPMLATLFHDLIFLELPLLMYEAPRVGGRNFHCGFPDFTWDDYWSGWFAEMNRSDQDFDGQLPAKLVCLVLYSQGDDHPLVRHNDFAGRLGRNTEETWVSELGPKSRLTEIIVKTRSSSLASVWVTKFAAQTAYYSELQGHCLAEWCDEKPQRFDSNVELLPDDFYRNHNCEDLRHVAHEFCREFEWEELKEVKSENRTS
ncbi:MAG: hypothetical protein M1835_006343 [Candelina submexicana]|nr:MAG: hypothetical protein M1835_006343 [Candelina submexicana]